MRSLLKLFFRRILTLRPEHILLTLCSQLLRGNLDLVRLLPWLHPNFHQLLLILSIRLPRFVVNHLVEELLEHPLFCGITLLQNKLVVRLVIHVPHLCHIDKIMGVRVFIRPFLSWLEPNQISSTLVLLMVSRISV